jgi:hypothetical protein
MGHHVEMQEREFYDLIVRAYMPMFILIGMSC